MKDTTVVVTLIFILADGKFYSARYLQRFLGIKETDINKHVQTIKYWGIDVISIPGKGYILLKPIKLLNTTLIQKHIKQGSIVVLPVVDSTNQYLFDRLNTLNSGDICIAEYQYNARGRRGRRWLSSFGANLYFSMYWHLKQKPTTIIGISLVIGIVIAEVLRDLGVNQIREKWPNDIYLLNRKLAGILIETTGKQNDVTKIVIGVGINLAMRSIQVKQINQGWINLQEVGIHVDRNILIIQLIRKLQLSLKEFEQDGLKIFLDRWNSLDNFINRPVKLIVRGKEIYGISRGINEQGALILEHDGCISSWIDGEISLRSE